MEDEIIQEFLTSVEKAIKSLKYDLSKFRTGRANLSLLDDVRVDYYGTPTPLNQLASMAVTEARLITIKPWDKSVITQLEKAILQADIGINPQNAGEVIRLPIPPLTEERRKDLAKQARARGEEAKISIRNIRRDANEMLKELQKEGDISEDDLHRALDKIQKSTNDMTAEVDIIIKDKEKEIMDD